MKKNLVLLGMMTVGKTTLGKIVAKNLGLSFIDTDEHIEKKNSMTIKEIFEKKGEKFFRLEEKKEIYKILKKNECVICPHILSDFRGSSFCSVGKKGILLFLLLVVNEVIMIWFFYLKRLS